MSTTLRQWQQHRTDYRVPGLSALLLLAALGFLLPADWLQLSWLGSPDSSSIQSPNFRISEDEGLQILDVEVLAPAPARPPAPIFEAQRIEPGGQNPPLTELEGGQGEFSWDPTRSYRLGDELLIPSPPRERGGQDDPLRRLEFLLSSEGVATYSLSDTSHAEAAHTSFTRLQREIFLQSAPGWAYDKAVERYRENMTRMLFDNPLRGPQ